jgi:small subunit ribosomal protein S21
VVDGTGLENRHTLTGIGGSNPSLSATSAVAHEVRASDAGASWIKLQLRLIKTDLGVMSLAEVRLQEGESLENALRRFKRKVQTEDIIKDVKRHSFYLKPGEKKRVKQALARKRARKKIRKDSE